MAASVGDRAHGVEQGTVQIDDLKVEAADDFGDGLIVVVHGSGEDEEASLPGTDGELVLRVAGSFEIVALGRRYFVKAGCETGGGAVRVGGGSFGGGGARGAIERGDSVPRPIVGGFSQQVVEGGAVR